MAGKRLLKTQPPRHPSPRLRDFGAEVQRPVFEGLRTNPSAARLEASSLQVAKATSQQLRVLGGEGTRPVEDAAEPDAESWALLAQGLVILASSIHVRQLLEAAAPFVQIVIVLVLVGG